MHSIERKSAHKPENRDVPVTSNQEVLNNGLIKAEDRFTGAKETIRKGQAELRGTPHEHDLDGAVVDLRAAGRTLHTQVIDALGTVAEQRKAPEAQDLVRKSKALLEAQARFAEAA